MDYHSIVLYACVLMYLFVFVCTGDICIYVWMDVCMYVCLQARGETTTQPVYRYDMKHEVLRKQQIEAAAARSWRDVCIHL